MEHLVDDAVLTKALDNVIEKMIQKYDDLGMRSSGQWAESLETRINSTGGEIWGKEYSEWLSKGREPGAMPPVQAIYEWVNTKPGFLGRKTWGVAWAIAKKISKEGTSWYEKGGTDLISFIQSDEVLRDFANEIGQAITARISEQLLTELKKI